MTSSRAKKTTQMSAAERKALQEKLDAALAQAMQDVSEFAELYEIIPSIRITNNKSRLGSAKVSNGARMDAALRKRFKMEKWDKPPVFEISISTRECGTEQDLRNTLYHEVIHCAPNCFNHGKRFKALATQVNAKCGTNVETRKKVDMSDENHKPMFGYGIPADLPSLASEKGATDARRLVASHIGASFEHGRKTYIFVGFNGNPKNCCDLVDDAGRQYKAPAELVAEELGLVSEQSRLAQRNQATAKKMAGVELKIALTKRIGESFRAGRKTYTFTGFNGNPKNCCDLVDARGVPYKCSMETLAHDLGLT